MYVVKLYFIYTAQLSFKVLLFMSILPRPNLGAHGLRAPRGLRGGGLRLAAAPLAVRHHNNANDDNDNSSNHNTNNNDNDNNDTNNIVIITIIMMIMMIILSCAIYTHTPARKSSTDFQLYYFVVQMCSTNWLGHGHGYKWHSSASSSIYDTRYTNTVCIIVLCYIMLYDVMLYYIVLHCIILYHVVLYCIILYYLVLYCIILFYIVLSCITLYYITLYCIILYYIVLYCIRPAAAPLAVRGRSVSVIFFFS